MDEMVVVVELVGESAPEERNEEAKHMSRSRKGSQAE
jgi:hypothetical protein